MTTLGIVDLTLRLLVAGLAAVLLGVEREVRGHAAGVRTHALVAIGAALFTLVGAYGFADVPRGPSYDPTRIAAQVASGIGFLGAGAILRQGIGVRGLTTAATLWLAAALGVASGAGAYAAVAVTTVVVLLVLVALRLAKPVLQRVGGGVTLVELEYERGHGTLGPLLRAVNALPGRLDHLELDDDEDEEEGLRRASLYVTGRDLDQLHAVVEQLRERPEVRAVRITRGAGGAPAPG